MTPLEQPAMWRHGVVVALVLSAIAVLAPEPWYLTDRTEYERVGREIIVADCSSLHCFRKLVPIVVEQLPGPSLVKWKTFAVISNALAAVAVGHLALVLGLSASGALLALYLSALGFGALFTLFDPHTADPLMFLLGPVLTRWLFVPSATAPASAVRIGLATVVAAVGVLAKEFAAAPLWMAAAAAALAKRRDLMWRAAIGALSVTTLWVLVQVTLITVFDYSYGGNPSSKPLEGGYVVHWVKEVGVRTAVFSLVSNYGPLFVLVPAGFVAASPQVRRWALAALPALMAFGWVQQPDRAIWNFHFLATPLAALVLTRLPAPAAWAFVACYALSNLRVGAQLSFLPAARYALLAALALAVWAAFVTLRARAVRTAERTVMVALEPGTLRRRLAAAGALNVVVLAALALVLADLRLHARVQETTGLNKWGYRGPVARHKQPDEKRLVVLGGPQTFGIGVTADEAFPAWLSRYLKQGWRKGAMEVPVSVVNLALPADGVASFAQTFADYRYLGADVTIIVAERPGGEVRDAAGWRHQSPVFRVTGYLPQLPLALAGGDPLRVDAADLPSASCVPWTDAVLRAVGAARDAHSRVLVVSPPAPEGTSEACRAALAQQLESTSGLDGVRYTNLATLFDLRAPANSPDGHLFTRLAHEQVAEGLTDTLLAMLRS